MDGTRSIGLQQFLIAENLDEQSDKQKIQRLEHLEVLINRAVEIDFQGHDFGNVDALFNLDPLQKQGLKDFQKFLGSLADPFYVRYIRTHLTTQHHFPNDQVDAAIQALTHFRCIFIDKFVGKVKGKRHSRHCLVIRQTIAQESHTAGPENVDSQLLAPIVHKNLESKSGIPILLGSPAVTTDYVSPSPAETEEFSPAKAEDLSPAETIEFSQPPTKLQQLLFSQFAAANFAKKATNKWNVSNDQEPLPIGEHKTPLSGPKLFPVFLKSNWKCLAARALNASPPQLSSIHHSDSESDLDLEIQTFEKSTNTALKRLVVKDSGPRASKRIRRRPQKFSPANFPSGRSNRYSAWPYCVCKTRRDSAIVECYNKLGCQHGRKFHYGKYPCVNFNGELNWICPGCPQNKKSDNKSTSEGKFHVFGKTMVNQLDGTRKNGKFRCSNKNCANGSYFTPLEYKLGTHLFNSEGDILWYCANCSDSLSWVSDDESKSKDRKLGSGDNSQQLSTRVQKLCTSGKLFVDDFKESTLLEEYELTRNQSKTPVSSPLRPFIRSSIRKAKCYIRSATPKISSPSTGILTNSSLIPPLPIKPSHSVESESSEFRNAKCTTPDVDYLPSGSEDHSSNCSDSIEYNEEQEKVFTADEICEINGIDKNLMKYRLPETFKLRIPFDKWKNVWKDNNIVPKSNYPQLINDAMALAKIPCSFAAKSIDMLSSNSKYSATCHGYCRKGRYSKAPDVCKAQFRCFINPVVENEDVLIDVKTSGNFVLFQHYDTSRPVQKENRRKLKKELATKTAKEVHVAGYSDLDGLRILHGNFRTQSINVERKIKSEANVESSRRKKDIVIALREVNQQLKSQPQFQCSRFPELSGYIQHSSDWPRITTLYSLAQLRYAATCSTLHFDSTGNVVPKEDIWQTTRNVFDGHESTKLPKLNYKNTPRQIMLHSAVAKSDLASNAKGIPVFECLSSSSTSSLVANELLTFVNNVRKYKKDWTPEVFVVDMCLAYLHASVLALNKESLADYINRAYDILFGQKEKFPTNSKTVVFVCNSHSMHAVARYLRKNIKNKTAIEIALFCFAQFVEVQEKRKFEDLVTATIRLFGFKKLDESERKSYEIFVRNKTAAPLMELIEQEDDFCDRSNEEMTLLFPEIDPKLEKDKSHFHNFFSQRTKFELTKRNNAEEGEHYTSKVDNPYYDPTVLTTLTRWMTYIPFWSKIGFVIKNSTPTKTITNGLGEQYFHLAKNIFHTTKLFKADLVESHAKVVINLVTEAVRRGTVKKTKRKMKTTINPNPPKRLHKSPTFQLPHKLEAPAAAMQFVSNKWKRNRKSKSSYKYQIASSTLPAFSATPRRKIHSENSVRRNIEPSFDVEEGDELAMSTKKPVSNDKIPSRSDKDLNTPSAALIDDPIMLDLANPECIGLDESKDPFKLYSKNWYLETTRIEGLFEEFGRHKEGGSGTECELATLAPGKYVSNAVADAYAKIIFDSTVGEMGPDKIFRLIESSAVHQEATQTFKPVVRFYSKLTELHPDSVLFHIAVFGRHAFLLEISLTSRIILFYDSLKGFVSSDNRRSYVKALTDGLEKFSNVKPTKKWQLKQAPTAEQEGAECIPMSLEALRVRLSGGNPLTDINMNMTGIPGRLTILKELLNTSSKGTTFLRNSKNDPKTAMQNILARVRERKIIDEITSTNSSLLQKRVRWARIVTQNQDVDKAESAVLKREIEILSAELVNKFISYEFEYENKSVPTNSMLLRD